jgi:hypothetical protein
LRRRLAASESARSDAGDPARLTPLTSEMLRDVVETYNIFIIGDPRGRELDQVRLGPQERATAAELIKTAAPIIEALRGDDAVATSDAKAMLGEQIDAAVSAPVGINGDQAIALASKSTGNLIVEMLRLTYAPIRRLSPEAAFAWKEMRAGAYRAVGTATAAVIGGVLFYPDIVAFIVRNADSLRAFVVQAYENPALRQVIDAVVQFGNKMGL